MSSAIVHPTDDFPEIEHDRPPMLRDRPRGVSDPEWRKVVAQYRSEKMDFEQRRRNRKIAADAEAKAVTKSAAPRKAVAKAPDRSQLLRTGDLDVAQAPITHSSRKARTRQARASELQWKEMAKQSRKAGALIKKMSPKKLATNPTGARLTGDAALAMNLVKRRYNAERKRVNDANRAANLAAKSSTRDSILDQSSRDRPARRHTRFPAPGAHKWADDEDVPTDDQVVWMQTHGFERKRTTGHQLHCNLSGHHFWATSRTQVVDETPKLEPTNWKMVKGVFTYHGRLPGGAPPTRPPPVHGSSVPNVSEQLYSYVNTALHPASITSTLTDNHISWFTACPDVVLLAIYGPRSTPTEDIIAQRAINMLRGARRPEPTAFYPPREDRSATRPEVATWAHKIEVPNPHLTVPLPDEDHQIQLTVVVGGTPQTAYVSTLEDATHIYQTIVDAGSAATITMINPTQVCIVIVPRLRGGSIPTRRNFPLRLITPQGPHTLWFPTARDAEDYIMRVSRDTVVTVQMTDDLDVIYVIHGRLPGGGRAKWVPKATTKQTSRVDDDFTNKTKAQQKREKDQADRAQAASIKSEIKKKQAEFSKSNGSSSSNAPHSVMDEDDSEPDYSEDELTDSAMDRVKTTGAEAKQALMDVIKNRVVAYKAHVEGEPDWNAAQESWDLKFIHLSQVWYFDGRQTEESRIELMDYTSQLAVEDGRTMFGKYFRSTTDEYLIRQIAFGWGARNYREFGNDDTKAISTPPSIARAATTTDMAHAWLMTTPPETFTPDFVLTCRAVYTGNMTPPMKTDLRSWMALNPAVGKPDMHTQFRFEAAVVNYCRSQDPKLTDPFCPLAPEEPEEEDLPLYRPSSRYATELQAPNAILHMKGRLANLPLYVHCKIAQFLQTAQEHTAEGYSMVTQFVDSVCGEKKVLSACLKFAVATAFAGLPFATSVAYTISEPVRYTFTKPIFGLRMYSRQTTALVLSDIKRVTALYDPTQTKVTLSADDVWNEEQFNGGDAERFVEHPDTSPQPDMIWSPNPLYRLAAKLTAETTQQVPPEANKPDSDLHDARAAVHSGEKLLVKHATVTAMTITSTCDGAGEKTHLLVCSELFALIVSNFDRYRSIISHQNAHVRLHASVLTATLLSSKSFNIPVVHRSRTTIEHDTAVAATIAIWSHLRSFGSTDPYESY